jgi:hypothetical protein
MLSQRLAAKVGKRTSGEVVGTSLAPSLVGLEMRKVLERALLGLTLVSRDLGPSHFCGEGLWLGQIFRACP